MSDVDMTTGEEVAAETIIAIHGPFKLTATGVCLSPDREATFDEWESATTWCLAVGEASPWWRAALLSYGEHRFGEKYTQAIEATGLAVGTLMNEVYVANHIDPSRRRENVPFAMHQEVAPLPPDQQDAWLKKVEEEGLNREELRAQIKASKAAEGNIPHQLWVIVSCVDANDQTQLYNRMLAEGRAVKMKLTQDKEK